MVNPFPLIFATIIFGVAPTLAGKSNKLEAQGDPHPDSRGRPLNPNSLPYQGGRHAGNRGGHPLNPGALPYHGHPAGDRGGYELNPDALPYQRVGRHDYQLFSNDARGPTSGPIGDSRARAGGGDGYVYGRFPGGAHDFGAAAGGGAGGPWVSHGGGGWRDPGVIHQASGHSGHRVGASHGPVYGLSPNNPHDRNQDTVYQAAVGGGPGVGGGGHELVGHQAGCPVHEPFPSGAYGREPSGNPDAVCQAAVRGRRPRRGGPWRSSGFGPDPRSEPYRLDDEIAQGPRSFKRTS